MNYNAYLKFTHPIVENAARTLLFLTADAVSIVLLEFRLC